MDMLVMQQLAAANWTTASAWKNLLKRRQEDKAALFTLETFKIVENLLVRTEVLQLER
jgi:hypothetical protein